MREEPYMSARILNQGWTFTNINTAAMHAPPPKQFLRETFINTHTAAILEILYCNPKGRRASLRVPSTVGRSICLCWALSQPEGPKGAPAKAVSG